MPYFVLKSYGAVGSGGDICGDRWLKMEKKGVKWGMSLFTRSCCVSSQRHLGEGGQDVFGYPRTPP